jgi:hypothetical protein
MFEKIKNLFRKEKSAVDPYHYREAISPSSPYLNNFIKVRVLKRDGMFIAELTTPIGEPTVACEAGRLKIGKLMCYAQHIAKWNHIKYECGL